MLIYIVWNGCIVFWYALNGLVT